MSTELETCAEQQAAAAESLPAFGGINLIRTKRTVCELAQLIVRGGFFAHYTEHGVSHINRMLRILDWLVPPFTRDSLTPSDWLLTVLSVYLHDLGMLVTQNEYANRHRSDFVAFRDTVLFGGEEGADYRDRLSALDQEAADRFLYQEFVRERHAGRIAHGIRGHTSERLGISHQLVAELHTLLRPLDPQVRADLALICESHHRDDLDDLTKYTTRQAYGNSPEEHANLHYAAILLRAADLLDITSDRAPSVVFRVISPFDPLSQEHWIMHQGVRAVEASPVRDEQGRVLPDSSPDRISVHARYDNPDAFFGLTSYLRWASSELVKCNRWAQLAQDTDRVPHSFP